MGVELHVCSRCVLCSWLHPCSASLSYVYITPAPALHPPFQIAYPLPKLDLVAIPNFAAGAMENWGLLMYREKALLVDDSQDDMHQRYAIATTVSHETVSSRRRKRGTHTHTDGPCTYSCNWQARGQNGAPCV